MKAIGPFWFSHGSYGWSFWIGDHFAVSYDRTLRPRFWAGFVR